MVASPLVRDLLALGLDCAGALGRAFAPEAVKLIALAATAPARGIAERRADATRPVARAAFGPSETEK
ncbi:MAG: hypothetical protein AAF647_10050 [Pseudomonadota bacterium]